MQAWGTGTYVKRASERTSAMKTGTLLGQYVSSPRIREGRPAAQARRPWPTAEIRGAEGDLSP
jgi:hypothetical protein